MKWTTEQAQAIMLDGTNIIVSAGAGSGKTAVLTARVIRKLEQGVNINELLILTFTRAAAFEMKERIRKAITKNPNLDHQIPLLDSAYITTFDSFALSIVRKYHYLLNMKQDIAIIDNNIIQIETKKILDDIFLELYTKKDPEFLKLISDLCIKDDKDIKQSINEINNKLDLLIKKEQYLDSYINKFYHQSWIEKQFSKYLRYINLRVKSLMPLFKSLLAVCDDDFQEKLTTAVAPIFKDYDNYDDLKQAILSVNLPRLSKGMTEEVSSLKTQLKKELDKLADIFQYQDQQELIDGYLDTKAYCSSVIKIIKILDSRITSLKQKYDMYAFNDIAKIAIKIVEENQDIQSEVKASFQEILIDEYQDTSDLQETFIDLIANNNVYMVGDIKQSIYRFRNANPMLFKTKYLDYSNNNGGVKIDLNKNFRSRKQVITNVNSIFNAIMDDEIGGANYQHQHQMIFGNQNYEQAKANQNYDYQFYNYQEFPNTFRKAEYEAFIIALDIKEKIAAKYQIYDDETKQLRDAKFNDFVILMDRAKDFDLYKKVFEYCQIPLTIDKEDDLTYQNDIRIIKNIMKLIIKIKNKDFNKEFEYAFISIARSYLYQLTDQEIFDYFANKNFHQSEIYQTAYQISTQIDALSNREFLKLIIENFKFFEKIDIIGTANELIVRFEYLEQMAQNLSLAGYDVYKYVEFIDEILAQDLRINYSVNKTNDTSCKIMTIHKSKGLEFSICYYSGLQAKFNQAEQRQRFIFDQEYGIICPAYQDGIKDTFFKDLAKARLQKQETSEKLRLLYVAMTRAKEKMIFVNSIESLGQKVLLDDQLTRLNHKSFDDFFKATGNLIKNNIEDLNYETYNISHDYKLIKAHNIENFIKQQQEINVKEINVDTQIISKKQYSKAHKKILSANEIKNIEQGLKLHYCLEVLDFHQPLLDRLNISNEMKLKLQKFLDSQLMTNISLAKVYKEYQFATKDSSGVIDLMLEYDTHIDIIDYKLKNINDQEYNLQLYGYRDFIKTKTNKQVDIYLYSILDEKYQKII